MRVFRLKVAAVDRRTTSWSCFTQVVLSVEIRRM